jgi:hypothetical protein
MVPPFPRLRDSAAIHLPPFYRSEDVLVKRILIRDNASADRSFSQGALIPAGATR